VLFSEAIPDLVSGYVVGDKLISFIVLNEFLM